MENLNDLIWTDEDGNNGISTQGVPDKPMLKVCMICLCKMDPPDGSGGAIGMGSNFACINQGGPFRPNGCM